jgi:hypothetical protein
MNVERFTPSHLISLTPDFSRVLNGAQMSKPLQRFSRSSPKAVETASDSLGRGYTWLKPGVNKSQADPATPEL